ncbi:MAG: hypothetical protein AAGF11_06865 [Myxococcota bacterium]
MPSSVDVQSGDAPCDGEIELDREDELCRVELRVEQLEELLHDGATESLRTRWAEELRWAHRECLELNRPERASVLQRRLATELDRPHASRTSRLVSRQHVAWAHVCLDAVVYRVDHGQDESALERLPELVERVNAIADDKDGVPMTARVLEIYSGLTCRREGATAVEPELEHLRVLARGSDDRRVRGSLARVLGLLVQVRLAEGEVGLARLLVEELGIAARCSWASTDERTALAEALLALHEHVGPAERVVIEQELGELATRPGAVQDQRKAWSAALDRSERSHQTASQHPLELLRARAYRGAGADDLHTLFERLEAELPGSERVFHEHIAVLNEMRAIAERPEVDPALRLRFARYWLSHPFNARRYDYGAVANDRSAYAWVSEAAERGDLEGQILLGRCLAHGRGTFPNRRAAVEQLRKASARGSDEAEQLIRMLGVARFPWLRHRYVMFMVVGFVVLVLHLLTQPFAFDPWGIPAFVGVMFGFALLRWALSYVVSLFVSPSEEDAASGTSHAFDRDVESFRRKPWAIVLVTTEDGLVLAPLAWLGITPLTAVSMALLFGLLHYPKYSPRICLYLTATYTTIALLVLPWAGLWAVTTGHVIWDVLLLYWGVREKRDA